MQGIGTNISQMAGKFSYYGTITRVDNTHVNFAGIPHSPCYAEVNGKLIKITSQTIDITAVTKLEGGSIAIDDDLFIYLDRDGAINWSITQPDVNGNYPGNQDLLFIAAINIHPGNVVIPHQTFISNIRHADIAKFSLSAPVAFFDTPASQEFLLGPTDLPLIPGKKLLAWFYARYALSTNTQGGLWLKTKLEGSTIQDFKAIGTYTANQKICFHGSGMIVPAAWGRYEASLYFDYQGGDVTVTIDEAHLIIARIF